MYTVTRISESLIEVRSEMIAATITTVNFFYYNTVEWTRSLLGKQGDTENMIPMSNPEIQWVLKHYLPKVDPQIAEWVALIGKQVWRRRPTQIRESKPFKSGRKVNTVKGIIIHPTLNLPAFVFEEDDSCVECRRCFLFSPVQMKFYQYWKPGCDDAEWVCLNELDDAGVECWFQCRQIEKFRQVPNPPIKWLRREMNIIHDMMDRMRGRVDLYDIVLKRLEKEREENVQKNTV